LASATAACGKAIAISYERRRSSERIFVDWIARCRTQLDAALAELDSFKRLSWPIHDRSMQTDITTACMLGDVRRVEPGAATKWPLLLPRRIGGAMRGRFSFQGLSLAGSKGFRAPSAFNSSPCCVTRLATDITAYLDAVAQAMGAPAMAVRATKLCGAP
jgi:hypothetical protein